MISKNLTYELETSIRGSDFFFDYVYLLWYKCRKINFERVRLHIDSPDRIKKQQ